MQKIYVVMKDHLDTKHNCTTPEAAFTNWKDAMAYRDAMNSQNSEWFEYWLADDEVELDPSLVLLP